MNSFFKKKVKFKKSFLFLVLIICKNEAAISGEGDEDPIRLFSGYDRRAPIGHHVFEQSVIEKSSSPVFMTPLYLKNIKEVFWREKSPTQLTDFTYSRFIVPKLCGFKGWSLFVDGNDMMMREDISKLWNLRDNQYAVMVVQHPEFDLPSHSFMGKSIHYSKLSNA